MRRIQALYIPTRNRPEALERAVGEAEALVARTGRSLRLCVVDRSFHAAARRRNRQRLSASPLETAWVGPAAVEDLSASLARRAAVDRDVVAFATGDPLGIGYAPGASRNVIALLGAGALYASFDDDMGLRPARTPGATGGIAGASADPTEFWFDPAAVDFGHEDPLAAHERLLSVPGIGATWNGFVGDGATANPMLYLGQDGPSRARLLQSRANYQRARQTRRVLRGTPRVAVGPGVMWTTGATAYDGTLVLPPFSPVLRGEGLVFSAQCRARRGPHFAYLDFVVEHLRPSGEAIPVAEPFPLAALLCRLAMGADSVPLDIRSHRIAHARATANRLERLIARYDGQPAWWAADARRHARLLLESSAGPDADLPSDLVRSVGPKRARRLLPELLAQWSRLVEAWPRLVTAAAKLGHRSGGGGTYRPGHDATHDELRT